MNPALRSDPNECLLSLYRFDKRISEDKFCDEKQVSFSKQTSGKANEIVAVYFDVNQEWDKKLLNCILLNNYQFKCMELNKIDAPEITYSIYIGDNKKVVFNEEEFYSPIECSNKLSVSFKSRLFGNRNYELRSEEIKSDPSLIALFNSNSFNRIAECDPGLGIVRRVEKLK